jgi:peptidoglycan/LPS O-acetylase OafA/YrhL
MKKKVLLENKIKEKNNNLNAVKFVAAIMVIISHAFSISTGPGHYDPIYSLTNTQISLGNFSVCIFLIIAGLLIAGSMDRAKKFSKFFKNRVLRLFPLLCVIVFITTFIVGPIFTALSLREYFTNSNTYLYFIKNCFLITTHNLPGVFADNIYNLSPNGSLWTLPIEFLCYIGCYIAYKLNFFNQKNLKYAIPIFIIFVFLQPKLLAYGAILGEALPLFLLFIVGMIYYVFKDKIYLRKDIFIVFIFLVLVSIRFDVYFIGKVLLLPYIIIYLSYGFKNNFNLLNKLGRLSYGIYLWGFLIQQIICNLFGGYMNPFVNFIIAIPITILLAYLSNILVENKVLKRPSH